MSQSATLIRVAKRALDGTALYPHHGQNTIYYQPFDLSTAPSSSSSSAAVNSTPTTKYLAYTIQRPHEHVISLASHHQISIVRICICISFAVEKEKKKMHLTVFAPSSDPILSLSFSLFYLFCLTRTEAKMCIRNERRRI